jgi:hypothetical protein
LYFSISLDGVGLGGELREAISSAKRRDMADFFGGGGPETPGGQAWSSLNDEKKMRRISKRLINHQY